jgi:hypothetical protein
MSVSILLFLTLYPSLSFYPPNSLSLCLCLSPQQVNRIQKAGDVVSGRAGSVEMRMEFEQQGTVEPTG